MSEYYNSTSAVTPLDAEFSVLKNPVKTRPVLHTGTLGCLDYSAIWGAETMFAPQNRYSQIVYSRPSPGRSVRGVQVVQRGVCFCQRAA